MSKYREPTADECSEHAEVQISETVRGYACWYPSMGGYAGKAVAWCNDDEGCIELLVWHDGQFPFGDDATDQWGREPVELHHCSPDQFVVFGQWLDTLDEPTTGEV